jgi:hypothetical protein
MMSQAVPPPAATATFAGNVRVTTTGGGGVGDGDPPPPPPPLHALSKHATAKVVATNDPRRKADIDEAPGGSVASKHRVPVS